MNARPYLLGVAGGSASGKTTLLRKLTEHYDATQLTLISQDNYYIERSQLPRNTDGEINFDHPHAVDLEALAQDIGRIARGETVTVKEYTFNNPNAEPNWISYAPAPIVLIEGLFVFTHPGLSAQLDLKVFVDADEHIRLSRRIRRDFEERGYTLDQVLDYYEKFVVPMYRQYIEPHKFDCDIIIPNNLHMQRAIAVLMAHLDRVLGG